MITVDGVLEDEDTTSEETNGRTVHVYGHDWTILEISDAICSQVFFYRVCHRFRLTK